MRSTNSMGTWLSTSTHIWLRRVSSFAHAAVMTLQAFRNFIARGELVGSAVLVVIGVALIVLAPPSVQRNGKVQATRRKELP
jgi:hypothetical protein